MTRDPSSLSDPPRAAGLDPQALSRLLLPGERLLWHGRPDARFALRGSDVLAIPFGIVFFAFALFWEARAIRFVCPAIVGIPFLWIGYQMAIGRLLSDARLRRYTTYALTTRRALIVCRRPGKMENVLDNDLAEVCRLDLRVHRDGTGSIAISTDFNRSKLASNQIRLWPSEEMEGLFQFIREPLDVLRQIRAARDALRYNQPLTQPRPAGPTSWFDRDEEQLWTGKPRLGFFFRREDLFVIPFSLVWFGFVLFAGWKRWNDRTARHGPPTVMEIVIFAPFIAAGILFTVGRFPLDIAARARTFYAVTARRLLILRGRGQRQYMVSLERDAITRIDLTEHADGTGTLTFNPPPVSRRRNQTPRDTPKFQRIADAENVKYMIKPLPQ